ncbi:hypothetical protein PHMEG_00015296 [Phytophthora megakarya]|uniref:Uncharacterized protein n=1 Tax=Phytophthora megakarya TaxID=4795 RepID=A0A225W3S1_9STRA|nr:hypothetical protein PHMEG_00015296 [Phytophthora megakarya]
MSDIEVSPRSKPTEEINSDAVDYEESDDDEIATQRHRRMNPPPVPLTAVMRSMLPNAMIEGSRNRSVRVRANAERLRRNRLR